MAFVMIPRAKATVHDRVHGDGTTYKSTDYFGRASKLEIGCEAFLTEMKNRTLGAHCHPVDQFQIFLGAEGSFYQRQAVPELMVHYADAYAVYGPLVGAEPALEFFTLRADPNPTTFHMPADRDQLPYRGTRRLHAEPDLSSGTQSTLPGGTKTDILIERQDDGLESLMITAEPGATVVVEPSKFATSGQFVYVAAGSVTFEGEVCPPVSLGWQDANEAPGVLVAGESGAAVVLMRYPFPATKTTQAHKDQIAS